MEQNKNIQHKIKVNINRNYNYYCYAFVYQSAAAGCEMFKYLQNRFCGIIIPIIVTPADDVATCVLYIEQNIEQLRGDVI